jgi:hypothetical protein
MGQGSSILSLSCLSVILAIFQYAGRTSDTFQAQLIALPIWTGLGVRCDDLEEIYGNLQSRPLPSLAHSANLRILMCRL